MLQNFAVMGSNVLDDVTEKFRNKFIFNKDWKPLKVLLKR